MSEKIITADDGRALLPTKRAAQLAGKPTDEQTPPAAPATAAAPAGDGEMSQATAASIVSEVAPVDLDALTAALSDRLSAGTQRASKLSQYSSLHEFVIAARAGDRDAIAAFAIAEQVSSDNPGLLQPTWFSEIKGIIGTGSPAITALGGPASPGDSTSFEWPYYDGDLSTLIDEQAAELDEVTSVLVKIKRASQDLRTFAGGSSISWQTILKSSPAYTEAYFRIMTMAYAMITDAAFTADIAAVPNADSPEIVLDLVAAGTTADAIAAKVFAASSRVADATGAPASVLLAAKDVFDALGGKFRPASYGTQNVSGIADAKSLRVEVSNLEVVRVPSLANGVMLATNPQACRWHGEGPAIATTDDVLHLGRDAAVWGMGTSAIYSKAGIVRFVKTATP